MMVIALAKEQLAKQEKDWCIVEGINLLARKAGRRMYLEAKDDLAQRPRGQAIRTPPAGRDRSDRQRQRLLSSRDVCQQVASALCREPSGCGPTFPNVALS